AGASAPMSVTASMMSSFAVFSAHPRASGGPELQTVVLGPRLRGDERICLCGEACEPVELGLGELAVVGDDDEMVLDQAEDLHREPEPLACIGVAGRGVAPSGDVIGLDLREHFFQQLAAKQLLGARAAGDGRLELVVRHLDRPPRMPPPRRGSFLRSGSLPPLSAATKSRPTARGMPSVERPAAAAYIARRCFSETGGMRGP